MDAFFDDRMPERYDYKGNENQEIRTSILACSEMSISAHWTLLRSHA
jgi:hypothetical protein